MRHLLTIIAVLTALVLVVPASAEDEPELYQPCTNTTGRTVVTLDQPFSDTVETPVGALNSSTVPAGTGQYLIDLAGLEVGERRTVNMTLTMLTGGVSALPVSDYDLIVNGENALSTDQPETHSLNVGHCQTITLDTTVFTGTPADTLSLDVAISNFSL